MDFFLLELKYSSDFAFDGFNKSYKFSKKFLQKGFKLILVLENYAITFDSDLVLLLIEKNFFLQEKGGKKYLYSTHGHYSFKIIFTLLKAAITLYI